MMPKIIPNKTMPIIVTIILGAFFIVYLGQSRASLPTATKENSVQAITEFETTNTPKAVDTVHSAVSAGRGFVSLLENLNIPGPNAVTVGKTLGKNTDLTNIKVGEPFYAVIDTNTNKIIEFCYTQQEIIRHYLFLTPNGTYRYEKHKAPTQKRHKLIEAKWQKGHSLWKTLHDANLGAVELDLLLKATTHTLQLHKKGRPGDVFQFFTEQEFHNEKLVDTKVIFVQFYGQKTGEISLYRYRHTDEKNIFNGFYTKKGHALQTGKYVWPLDEVRISSVYGYRTHPLTGRKTFHRGTDMMAPEGTPLRAIASGVVTKSVYGNGTGNYVVIKHTDGTASGYMHLHERYVQNGDKIKAAQIIGTVGNTGRSTQSHLHLEFQKKTGQYKDPMKVNMYAGDALPEGDLDRFTMQIRDIHLALREYQSEITMYLEQSVLAQK